MSTHSYKPELRRGSGRFAFSILGGLLLALQFVLSPVAFATSSTRGNADPPPAQALSEVAVVRLVLDYTPKAPSTATNAVLCTSLGVLVNSWPARNSTDLNSWVLTGSALTPTSTPCGPANATGKPARTYTLATIEVYANTSYTGNTVGNALLGTYTAVPSNPVLCSTPCSSGGALFAFHTNQPQPTLAITTTNTTQQFGIELTNGTTTTPLPPQPVPSTATAQQFLDPTAVALDSTTTQPEVGMPLLNTQGQLVAMRLQGTALFTAAEYQAFITQRAPFTNAPPNRLQAAWENGITAYYAHNYQAAITSFAQVETLNPNLKAATHFKQQAAAQVNTSQGSPSGSNTVTSFFGIPRSTFLIIVIIAGFLLLIVLLIIARTWARRRHELARFESERAEAQRNAEEKLLQRQKAQQNIMPVEKPNQVSLLLDNASSGRNVSTINSQSPPDTLCPNCGHAVRAGATYCPNCRYQLSPLSRDVPPTLNIFPVSELPIIDKAPVPSTTSTSQPEQAPVKETALDDLAIQATLKRLWDKAGR